METASITFITGGVRSGKSSFAEKVAIDKAREIGASLHYIATGIASDSEMKKRIARHQKDRYESGEGWKTWEQATDIGTLAPYFKGNDVLLLDCLTTLLSNELFSPEADLNKEMIYNRILSALKALEKNCHHVILVSNEVLFEPHHDKEFVFTYGKLLGNLHQRIVSMSNQAFLVEAGIPILMKGDNR